MILSYGLGVDSTAILLRWLHEPASRDFELDDLVVVVAMTGDEWAQTGIDVETSLLPLLREHGVRLVQVARGQRLVTVAGDGVVVLDDSASPTRLHLRGSFKLSDEMLAAGTIPQTGGARLCSVHSKGDALDPVIADLVGDRPYRHVVGFEATETRRAAKDATYNDERRTGEYPLLVWDWDRAACEAYILDVTGVAWDKSSCSYCPFSLTNKAGRARMLSRYADEPTAGVDTLFLEHVALALNPAQGLVAGRRAVDIVAEAAIEAPELTAVIDGLAERLDATEHALYEIRRILRPRKDDPTKMANASRAVRRLETGTRADMLALLRTVAAGDITTGEDGIDRAYLRTRGETLPAIEEFLVVAPAVVEDKQVDSFEGWWADFTALTDATERERAA